MISFGVLGRRRAGSPWHWLLVLSLPVAAAVLAAYHLLAYDRVVRLPGA